MIWSPAMTMLDKFIAFASALPAEQRESVEEALAALMETLSAEFDLKPAGLPRQKQDAATSVRAMRDSDRY